MKRLALACTATLVATSLWAAPKKKPAGKAAAAPTPTVTVAGLRIVGPGFGRDGMEARPFNWSQGTTVVVALQVPDPAGLVGVDTQASTVEMTDSSGQALERPDFGFSPDVTKDGKTALLELQAAGVPGPQATAIQAKGTLTVRVSPGARTQKVNSFRLEKGKTLKIGTDVVTLDAVEAGEGSQRLTLKGPRVAFQSMKALRFIEGGKPVESDSAGYSFSGDEGEVYYTVSSQGKAFTVEMDIWQSPQTLNVPFDLRAGLGVGQR